jgi:uncharacterized protein YozE (UPF0346 family)
MPNKIPNLEMILSEIKFTSTFFHYLMKIRDCFPNQNFARIVVELKNNCYFVRLYKKRQIYFVLSEILSSQGSSLFNFAQNNKRSEKNCPFGVIDRLKQDKT